MAFAARLDDDKTWRLCLRKGKTIRHIFSDKWPDIEIVFSSQAKAKACADELNEKFWKAYEKHETNTPDCAFDMLEVIRKHDGLTYAQYEEIKNG